MEEQKKKLNLLKEEILNCTNCSLSARKLNESLIDTVKKTYPTFARGNPNTKIIFLAEAPGQEESYTGLPFMGRAGKLLDKMIEAMGLTENDVYILNTVCCRPPNNRKPLPEEMIACRPFLLRHLELIQPKIIITLGATATEALLGKGKGILKMRGRWSNFGECKVMPTIHPSGCLRNPEWKLLVRDDLKMVLDEYEKL